MQAFAAVPHRLCLSDIRTGDKPVQRHRHVQHDLAHHNLLRTLGAACRVFIPERGRETLEAGPSRGKFLGGDPREVAKAAQHRLVRTQLLGRAAAHSVAHAPGQNPVHIGNG